MGIAATGVERMDFTIKEKIIAAIGTFAGTAATGFFAWLHKKSADNTRQWEAEAKNDNEAERITLKAFLQLDENNKSLREELKLDLSSLRKYVHEVESTNSEMRVQLAEMKIENMELRAVNNERLERIALLEARVKLLEAELNATKGGV